MKFTTFTLLAITLLLHGCSAKKSMIALDASFAPASDYAVVTFLKASHGQREPIGIWEREKFKGFALRGNYIQVKVKSGNHLFLAHYKNRTSYLNIDVEAGKHYLARLRIMPVVGVNFVPFRRNDESAQSKINEWLDNSYTPMVFIEGSAEKYKRKYTRYIKKWLRQYDEGRARLVNTVNARENVPFPGSATL